MAAPRLLAPRGSRGTLRVFLPTFLLLSLVSTLWALATPVFGSPDENAHAIKAIAQVRGELFAHSRPGVRFPVYDLPDTYRYSPGIVCFAFDPTVSAACNVELGTPHGTNWSDDWVSTYNPVYYYAVGWVTLVLDGSAGIYGMRILSALFCSALLAGAFVAALGARRARWMPAGLTFLAAPMAMFLAGSVNPQAVEFIAGALMTVALLRLIEKHRNADSVSTSLTGLWVLTTVGAVLLTIARASGPLWLVIVVVGVFFAAGWRDGLLLFRHRRSYPFIGVIVAFGVFALAWTLLTGSVGGQAAKADAPLVGGTFVQGFWAMLRATPFFAESAAGVFGWQDTILPSLGYALIFGALVILFALVLSGSSRRGRIIVTVSLVLAILVPAVVQAVSISHTGLIWQGRYGMFLYLAVILIASWVLSHDAQRLSAISVPITAIISVLMAAYGAFAFVAVLRRYVVGTDVVISKMVSAPEWQPPLGWPALVSLDVIAVLAFAGWNIRLAVLRARAEDEQPARTSTPP